MVSIPEAVFPRWKSPVKPSVLDGAQGGWEELRNGDAEHGGYDVGFRKIGFYNRGYWKKEKIPTVFFRLSAYMTEEIGRRQNV
jgi:hypothetical protein